MKSDQQRQLELTRQLQSAKKTIVELQDDINRYQKLDRESEIRVRELEASLVQQREDVDVAQQRARLMRDELTEKDEQLRITSMSLDTAEKQNQQQMNQVDLSLLVTFADACLASGEGIVSLGVRLRVCVCPPSRDCSRSLGGEDNVLYPVNSSYFRHRLASGKGIVTLAVTQCVCVFVCVRRISLGGEGNTLYSVLSSLNIAITAVTTTTTIVVPYVDTNYKIR